MAENYTYSIICCLFEIIIGVQVLLHELDIVAADLVHSTSRKGPVRVSES
jgi:hypothetical protein